MVDRGIEHAMTDATPNLHVRQHERRSCDIGVDAIVASSCASQVALAAGAAGGVPARLTDFSIGGLGLRVGVFLPKGCMLIIRLATAGAHPVEFRVKVRRVNMTDESPTYYLGVSFDEDGREEAIEALAALTSRTARSA
jgi:hypothetical protein